MINQWKVFIGKHRNKIIVAVVIAVLIAILALFTIATLNKIRSDDYAKSISEIKSIKVPLDEYIEAEKTGSIKTSSTALNNILDKMAKANDLIDAATQKFGNDSAIKDVSNKFNSLEKWTTKLQDVKDAYDIQAATVLYTDYNKSLDELSKIHANSSKSKQIVSDLKSAYQTYVNDPPETIDDMDKKSVISAIKNIINAREELNKIINNFNEQSSLDELSTDYKAYRDSVSKLQ